MAKGFKEKICERCGKLYKPTSSTQRYCTECGNKNRKYTSKLWRENNKEYLKQYNKQWKEENKEHLKEYIREYCTKHSIERNEYNKQWREQNKEYKKEYEKQWYEQNKEYRKEYNKQWRKENIEHLKEYNKKYISKNRTKINTRANNYKKQRKQSDSNYKLRLWCRDVVYRCLKSKKDNHTFDILNYTTEQLRQRLEMNFKPDMNWENHGTLWHIDHIKPLCKFNLILPDGTPNYEQIRLANSLANLQPLYVTDNLSKGGKFN